MLLKRCSRMLAVILTAAMLPVGAAVNAAENDTVNIVACADTYVNGGDNGSNNYGSEEVLQARRMAKNLSDNKNEYATYIKFDLSALSGMSSDYIDSVELSLKNTDSKACSADIYATEWVDWEENKLCATDVEYAAYSDIENNYEYINALSVAANEKVKVDVTDYVCSLLENGSDAFTLVIIGEKNSSVIERKMLKLASRETQTGDGNKPSIAVTKKKVEPRENSDAEDDGYVSETEPAKNFAGNKTLLAGGGNISFFKFNIQDVDISRLKSAKFSLYTETQGMAAVSVYEADDEWSSATLTYENMPEIGDLCKEAELNGGEMCEINVTGAVAAAAGRGDTSISFAIKADTENVIGITSTYAVARRPKLTIEQKSEVQTSDMKNTAVKFSKVAYVQQDNNRDTNFGGLLYIKMGSRQGLVGVDISAAADTDFSRMILSLYTEKSELTSAITNTDAYAIASDWTQDTVTYNNMPERGRLIGSFSTQAEKWSKLDVTDYAKEELAKGNREISLLLVQNTSQARNMIISDTNSAQNASMLNIYYPSSELNKLKLADGSIGGWELSGAELSQGIFTLRGDAAKAVSPDYEENAAELNRANWGEYKFLVKALIKTDTGSGGEIALAGGDVRTRLVRTVHTDDGVKVYTNTAEDASSSPQAAFGQSFGCDEWVLFEATIADETVSYYINGKPAGRTTFTNGLAADSERLEMQCSGNKVEFSNVDMSGFNIYSGNRKFDVNADGKITVDSLDCVEIPFTTEISADEFFGCVSINGKTVENDRLSVGDDGKTLKIAPDRNGFEAYSDNLLYIDAENVRDIFGEAISSLFISRSFAVTGWKCSASVVRAARERGSAEVVVKIKNMTAEDKDINILIVRASGSEDAYMFKEKAIKKAAVSAGSEYEESVLLDTLSEDGFIKVFVYENGTYEPVLRIPYIF